VYILRCVDGSLEVGHTDNLASRLAAHNDGSASDWTARRRPVELVYSETCSTLAEAVSRERQLKRWSGKKKEALATGDVSLLHMLSRRRLR
jgi:predicted GIY-YIG superfamily endonuclease